MRYLTTLAALLCLCISARAAGLPLKIDLSAPITPPMTGHLKMGGANPQGVEINSNSRYITLGGKPWFPVMGEMHYSRYPEAEWEKEIQKMKAGGINIISAYIFWIHHEEIEGQWDWAGDKDLGKFVQLCAKHGMYVWLRLGPWDHGEVRSGGLPDWLLAKFPNTRQLRTTDPAFMNEVRKLYDQEFQQVKGQLYKDGGPIIGIQVENELRNNANYLLALKNLAKEIGFDVPLYSQTGWGPAQVPQDEIIPMFGGYGDGFWIGGSAVTGQTRVQYFFTHNPNDEKVTLSTVPGEAPANMAYLKRYPYLTCEIGGGMAIAYARRPLMTWQDVTAVALDKLGNGSNLMGYYMYHGGANPDGKLSTLQESELTPYTNDNDLTVKHYDFQAPLGEFGQVRQSYHSLRNLHMFLADFGSDLCTMPSTLPQILPRDLNDTDTLRWAARSDRHSGYIFINNYERGVALPAKDAQFALHTADGDLIVPASPISIPSGAFMIWPFNLDMNGVKLTYATAQLLCRIDGENPTYVFFAPDGVESQLAFDTNTLEAGEGPVGTRSENNGTTIFSGLRPGEDCLLTLHSTDAKDVKVLILTQQQARQCWKVNIWGAQRLAMSPGNLYWDDSMLTLASDQPDRSVSFYPPPRSANDLTPAEGVFVQYPIESLKPKTVNVTVTQTKPAGPARTIPMSQRRKPLPPTDADFDAAATWQITLPPDAFDGAAEVLLKIDYIGDAARAYIGDKLIDDDFYFGKPWEIGLKRFAPDVLSKGITLKILPLKADSPVYIEPSVRPKAGADGTSLELRGVTAEVQSETVISGK